LKRLDKFLISCDVVP